MSNILDPCQARRFAVFSFCRASKIFAMVISRRLLKLNSVFSARRGLFLFKLFYMYIDFCKNLDFYCEHYKHYDLYLIWLVKNDLVKIDWPNFVSMLTHTTSLNDYFRTTRNMDKYYTEEMSCLTGISQPVVHKV